MRFSSPKKVLSFIIGLSLLLNITGIWWGLPNYDSWTPDYVGGTAVLGRLFNGFSGQYRNPPLHFALNAVFYLPYLGFIYLTGGLQSPASTFPYGFTDPLSAFGGMFMITRLITIAFAAATVYVTYLVSKEVHGKEGPALFSALIVSLCPIFVVLSKIDRLDVPMAFYIMASLLYGIRAAKRHENGDLLLFGVTAALALSTKVQALSFYVLPTIFLAALQVRSGMKDGRHVLRAVTDRGILLMVAAFVVTYVVANYVIVDPGSFLFRVGWWASGQGNVPWQVYPPTPAGQAMILGTVTEYLSFGMTFALFAASVLGIIHFIKHKKVPSGRGVLLLLLLAILSLHLFTFAVTRVFISPRYVLPMALVLSLFGGGLLFDMFSGGGWKKAAAITIIAFSLSQALSIDLLMMNDSRYYAESWFTENVDRDAEIEFYFVNKGKLPRLEALGYTNLVSVSPDPVNLSRLSERDPDYIIVTFRSVALQEDLERYYDSLLSGSMGYVPVAHFRTEVQFLLQEPINYVNPEITVLKRL